MLKTFAICDHICVPRTSASATGNLSMPMPRLVLRRRTLAEVVGRCTSSRQERVFVGIGRVEGDRYVVEEVFECKNISPFPETRFVADPMCMYRVYVYAEERGWEIAVLIHSHPAPPAPSSEDLKGMKMWRVPWLIVDSSSGAHRAWMLVDDRLQEVALDLL